MKLIAAVDRKLGLGRGNALLYHVKEDMRFFRRTTRGKVVVMGAATLRSLPGGRPLPDRVTVVLSASGVCGEDFTTVRDLDALFETLARFHPDDVYVCGGASVYALLAPYCDGALVTEIDAEREADRFFPDLSRMPGWRLKSRGETMQSEDGLRFCFCEYENAAPARWKA